MTTSDLAATRARVAAAGGAVGLVLTTEGKGPELEPAGSGNGDRPEAERGRYLHPAAFGQPVELSVGRLADEDRPLDSTPTGPSLKEGK